MLKEPRRRLRMLQDELNKVMEGPLSDGTTAKCQKLQLEIEQKKMSRKK
jgi:hypothetical protein